MLKCAIIGVSGGRARGLAEAYRHVTHGKLAAISTRTEESLHAFGDTFDVDIRDIWTIGKCLKKNSQTWYT